MSCRYKRPCNCCPCGHCDCFFYGIEDNAQVCCGCGEERVIPDGHTEARLNDIYTDDSI